VRYYDKSHLFSPCLECNIGHQDFNSIFSHIIFFSNKTVFSGSTGWQFYCCVG